MKKMSLEVAKTLSREEMKKIMAGSGNPPGGGSGGGGGTGNNCGSPVCCAYFRDAAGAFPQVRFLGTHNCCPTISGLYMYEGPTSVC